MNTVVVTGCDYGLGVDLVRCGLAGGGRVFAGCLNPPKAKEMKALAKEHGEKLVVFRMDMSSEASIRRSAASIRRKAPRVDLLINNAGVFAEDGLEKVNFDDFARMFAVNTFGPAVLIRELHEPLRKAGGSIVNITSEAGSMAGVTNDRPILAYGASKAAMNAITRRLSFILATDGIRVIAVHPGWLRTPMGRAGGDEPTQEPSDTARDVFVLAAKLKLDAKMSGGFFDHSGRTYPW
jgi:NAD(P)-dependent dehydrogenase (short-subunit alcohol dehydrogenase family)